MDLLNSFLGPYGHIGGSKSKGKELYYLPIGGSMVGLTPPLIKKPLEKREQQPR